MKKLLSVLLVSVLLIGCSEDRVFDFELINKGTKDIPIEYYEGKLYNGIVYGAWINKQVNWKGNYKDGKRDGLYIEWDEYGKVREEINFKDGVVDGLSTFWDYSGKVIEEANFKDGKCINGVKREWDSNGYPKRYTQYINGKKDGLDITYHSNRKKMFEINYYDGKKDGEYKHWDEDGKLIEDRFYENGYEVDKNLPREM